jgi:formyl-CoA transferase
VNHPDIGSVEYPIAPSRLSRTPGGVKFRGPRLGEHTTTVIAEWLGYGEHEVADLRRLGAIWQPNEERPGDKDVTEEHWEEGE